MQKMLTAALAISAIMTAPHAYSSALTSAIAPSVANNHTTSTQGNHDWCRGVDPTNPGKLVWVNGHCP